MSRHRYPCIVLGESGALELVAPERGAPADAPPSGVLMYGKVATVFPCRRSAHRAIERTLSFAAHAGLPWNERHHVVTLSPLPDSGSPAARSGGEG